MEAKMKQLTLRQLPLEVERELRQRADRNGTSINRTAIDALKKGLNLAPQSRRRRDLSALAGKWTAAEADEFDKNVRDLDGIDEDVWR